jgi:uncharacterized membrane protein
MDYIIVKWLHILSSTIILGTGVGSAFFMFLANRRKSVSEIYFAARHVVVADWLFTTPAVLFQFVSGFYLMHATGYHMNALWLSIAVSLYFFAGVCWVPVVWMQIKMRDMAKRASEKNEPLPDRYWAYDRWWIILGSLAFPAVIVIFWLMVAKPV